MRLPSAPRWGNDPINARPTNEELLIPPQDLAQSMRVAEAHPRLLLGNPNRKLDQNSARRLLEALLGTAALTTCQG